MARQKNPPSQPAERLFLDTSYVIARFNRRDQYHRPARKLANLVAEASELSTTDGVLLEVASAFSHPDHRSIAVAIWDEFHGRDQRCQVCQAAGQQLDRAVELFRQRSDKAWSLIDCLSFVVMDEQQLTVALTADSHFIQAGFRAVLLES